MKCRECKKEVPDRIFGYCEQCAKDLGAEQEQLETIIRNLLYHDSWESKDNETLWNESIKSISSLIKKAQIKVHEEYVEGGHCGYELYAEECIENLKGELGDE